MTYCVDCQTELPEGARYCFKCGKAVGGIEQGRKRIGGGQLVPVMKEEPDSREYVRIRDVVSVSDDAAALVVYCHASQQGQTVRVGLNPHSGVLSNRRVVLETLHASVVARQVGGRTFYAAIFPRRMFFTYEGEKACITQAQCLVKGLGGFRGIKDHVEARQSITLYPGIITEVDWSTYERIEDDLSL